MHALRLRQAYAYLTLEATVTILEGPDAPAMSLRLSARCRAKPTGPLSWFGAELDEDAFLRRMIEEHRLIYRFDVQRAYELV